MSDPRPFTLHVADATLDDLQQRLARARFPDLPPHGEAWEYGADVTYLRDLVGYWRDGFDWRKQEAALNAFPQFTAEVAGINLHFLHVPGVGPRPMPLLLSHGWPGSIWEFYKIIPLLTDPGRFGGDPSDAFTVVAPSLPGYTLSFQPGQPRFGVAEMGNAFVELMRDVLGYERFLAQGGDWGSFISTHIGLIHPSSTLGVHINLIPLRREPPNPALAQTPEVLAYRDELDHWLREETGYSAIQGTKPQTLAFGLTDSPTGLAAWIVEKFRTWSDNRGNLENSFSRDDLLTNVMLYWTTGAIASSFWPYYVRQHAGWPLPSADRRVEVPTAYQSFPKDILHPPRAVAELAFNIQRWTVAPRGGHFAALEAPDLLAEDVRAFARALR
ncbi:MAG: alpha/beta fold hydrolase [Chloroflexi bacterium]|nr:alpha/beta fold hydrolase [Chloroflexota bacterium]